jgi:hypothetical protein
MRHVLQGGVSVDARYRALSRVRSEQAGQSARSVVVFKVRCGLGFDLVATK